MATVDLDHPPEGVVVLPEPESARAERRLDPRAWVQDSERPEPRQLRRRVAEHLAEARELGEV